MLFITIALIVLVAAFNIISTLVMMVLEKKQRYCHSHGNGLYLSPDHAHFYAARCFDWDCRYGAGSCSRSFHFLIMDHYRVIQLPLDVYYIPYLPFHIRAVDFTIVTLTALLISFISTLYPALRASHINPAEALRYE